MATVEQENDHGADKPSEPVVEVRETPIGRGVFALRKFRRGEVIDEVRGRVLYDPDYSSDYCMDLGAAYSLEPDTPFRYLNHSCQPNAELFQYEDEEGNSVLQMWVHAVCSIQPGEQITIDYSWPAHAAIACRCGSPKCRGWIVDPAELELVTDRRKKGKGKRNRRGS